MKILMTILMASFAWSAQAAVVETKCSLLRNIDTVLQLPEEISIYRDAGQVYIFDVEDNKVACADSENQGIKTTLCGTSDEGLYFLSKGTETVLLDAGTFMVLATYACE